MWVVDKNDSTIQLFIAIQNSNIFIFCFPFGILNISFIKVIDAWVTEVHHDKLHTWVKYYVQHLRLQLEMIFLPILLHL